MKPESSERSAVLLRLPEPWTASSSADPEFAFNFVAALSDWRDFAAMKNTFSGEIDRFGAFRIGKPSDAI